MAEHKRYAEEFKLQAARLIVEHGYTYRQASEQLGVHGWSIRQWVRKFRESGQLPPKDQPVACGRTGHTPPYGQVALTKAKTGTDTKRG